VSLLSPGDQPLDVTRFDVEDAAQRIAPHVRRTPVLELEPRSFGIEGLLTLKLEFLQHTGSFKPRGAFNRILSADIDDSGVLAASGGNFGLAVAHAAHELGYPAEIFVPASSPAMKIERIRSYGATVHVIDGFYADAYAACEERAFDTGAVFMHPYDQPAVVAGQGTIASELSQQAPALTTVIVAVGGGGLIGGIAAWYAGTGTRVVAVEPELCPALHDALEAGEPVPAPVGGIAADALGASQVGLLGFAAASGAASVLVSDEDITAARRTLWRELRLVVEPAGATAYAALKTGAVDVTGQRVGVVVCGANTDPSDLVSQDSEPAPAAP
jgi:threonine dehydratase